MSLFYYCKKAFVLMHIWMIGKNLMKHHYLKKEDFYSHYSHAKRVYKDLEIKRLGEYHDLYVQGNTLLLANVFENFRNMCLKLCKLEPEKFLSAPGLAWEPALKRDERLRYFN